MHDKTNGAANKPAEVCCGVALYKEDPVQTANTARHYSQEQQASSLADQLCLSANEHTALLAVDEHRVLRWHD